MNDPSFLFFVFMIIVGSSMLLHHIFTEAKKELVTTPLLFSKFIRKDDNMALIYEITVGPPADGDTTERHLVVDVNDVVVHNRKYFYATENFGEFSFNEGDSIVISLVDIDNAGNESEPAVVAFIAKDTIPPSPPNALGIKILREENDYTPTPVEVDEVYTPEETIPDPSGIDEI